MKKILTLFIAVMLIIGAIQLTGCEALYNDIIGGVFGESSSNAGSNVTLNNHQNVAIPCTNNKGLMSYYDEAEDNYYFIYELGTIEHILLEPLVLNSSLKYNNGLTDLDFTFSTTHVVEEGQAKTIGQTVSNSVSSSREWENAVESVKSKSNNFGITAGLEIPIKAVTASIEGTYGFSQTESMSYSTVNGGSSSSSSENSYTSSATVHYTEQVSTTITQTHTISKDQPKGYYAYVHAANVEVFAIVSYDKDTRNYSLSTYSVVNNAHDMMFYYPDLEALENPQCGTLPYDVPLDEIFEIVESENYYTIEYNANGGTGSMWNSLVSLDTDAYLMSNAYERQGYIFLGWKTGANENDVAYGGGAKIRNLAKAGEKITLYAHWVPKKQNVTFDLNGGSFKNDEYVTNQFTVEHGDIYRPIINGKVCDYLPEPIQEGCKFLGWYVDDTNVKVDSGTKVSVAGDHKLVAKWEYSEIQVTFSLNGGQNGPSGFTYYSDPAKASENKIPDGVPLRDSDWTFVGWSEKQNPSPYEKLYSPGESVNGKITQNTTLYAVWVRTRTTVSINNRSNDSNRVYVDSDGDRDYFDPDFNIALLTTNNYTTFKITVKVYGAYAGPMIWNFYNEPYFDFECVDASSNTRKILEQKITPFLSGDYKLRTSEFQVNINEFSGSGRFALRYDTTRHDWKLGDVSVTIEALK